jgi:hypothetical protein
MRTDVRRYSGATTHGGADLVSEFALSRSEFVKANDDDGGCKQRAPRIMPWSIYPRWCTVACITFVFAVLRSLILLLLNKACSLCVFVLEELHQSSHCCDCLCANGSTITKSPQMRLSRVHQQLRILHDIYTHKHGQCYDISHQQPMKLYC